MRLSARVVLLIVVAGLLLAGCGESTSTSTTTAATTASGTAAAPGTPGTSNPGHPGFVPASARERDQSRLSQKHQQAKVRKALEVAASVKGASLPNGVLAKVDGTPITVAAYNQELQATVTPAVQPLIANPSDYSACTSVLKARAELVAKTAKERHQVGEQAPAKSESELEEECQQRYKQLQQSALSGLITRLQTQIQAKELGATVNQAELAKQVTRSMQTLKAIEKSPRATVSAFSETPKYTEAAVREIYTQQQLQDAIIEKVNAKFTKHVSKAQVQKYFSEHKQLYADSEPESRHIVLTSSASKSTAESAAKQHGSGGLQATAKKQGLKTSSTPIGCSKTGQTGSPLFAAVCLAKLHTVTGPVTWNKAYYVFELTSITPAKNTPARLTPVLERTIEQSLSVRGEGQGQEKFNEQAKAKLKAETECATGHVVGVCSEYKAPDLRAITKAP